MQKPITYLKTLPIKRLRQYQDIINYQIDIAYKRKMIKELDTLNTWFDEVTQAIYYITFIKK